MEGIGLCSTAMSSVSLEPASASRRISSCLGGIGDLATLSSSVLSCLVTAVREMIKDLLGESPIVADQGVQHRPLHPFAGLKFHPPRRGLCCQGSVLLAPDEHSCRLQRRLPRRQDVSQSVG